MSNNSLVINTQELSDVVNALDKIIADIEKCSSDFFKEITYISTTKEFQGYTADNFKMFAEKFKTTTGNQLSEVTSEIKKHICMKDGYIDKIILKDKFYE